MRNLLKQVLLLILSFHIVEAQQVAPRSIQLTSDSLQLLAENVPAENIYLHTNKDVYEAGENLWFGAMALYSQYMRLSDLSTITYVELKSAETEKTVAREMFALESGRLKGHLYLPDTLSSGTYWLMAFTANSLKYTGTPVRAVKKIMVKTDIIPHVLIQTRFDKHFLEDNDPVSGEVRLLTPGGDPVIDTKTIVALTKGNKTQDRNRLRSDSSGRMSFKLDHKSEIASLSLSIKMDHDDHDELFQRPLPYDNRNKVQLQFMPEGGSLLAGKGNMVAFKAVDKSGLPFDIKKARVYAEGEVVTEFSSEHDGMGKFPLLARSGVSYSVKIDEPYVDSIYQIPSVQKTGFQLRLHRQAAEELTFGLVQTDDLPLDSVHLMVKQRGVTFWLGSTIMKENGVLVKVPLTGFPQGIVEATLYNKNHVPVAERLVFIGLDKQLEITATVDKRIHGVKEKATVRFTVKDQNGNPVTSLLNIKAVDEVFNSPYAETNMMTHFLLSSDLKGNIHKPAYYFDKDNSEALAHLDLLLLTQGWRNYAWQIEELKSLSGLKKLPLHDYLEGKVDEKSLSRSGRNEEDKEVLIFSKAGAIPLSVDTTLSFVVSSDFLYGATGMEFIIKVPDEDHAEISLSSGFEHTESNRDISSLNYPLRKVVFEDRNWDKLYVAPPAAREVAGVEIVDNKSKYGLNRGFLGDDFEGSHGDYVCHNDILNCVNHRGGRPPIEGRRYTYKGRSVIYKAADFDNGSNVFRAFYKTPEFYKPDYDSKPQEKLLPDFRNTLIWETNLVTDENGEVEVSCFTSDIRSIFNGRVEAFGGNSNFGLGKFTIKVLK